jgi:hypothetical protein
MTAALERRYAALLRLYPARCHRDEMLDTALQAARADQRWPSLRETASLLLGAARARTGADMHRSPAGFVQSAGRLAALTLLVYAAAHDAVEVLPYNWPMAFREPLGFLQPELAGMVAFALHVGAIVALARGRYGRAAICSALGAGSSVVLILDHGPAWALDREAFWPAPLAAVLVLALLRGGHRERGPAGGWLVAVPLAVALLPTQLSLQWLVDDTQPVQPYLAVAVLGIALLWSAVDARVPVAAGAVALTHLLNYLSWARGGGLMGPGSYLLGIAIAASPAILLFAAGVLLARRRVQL